MRLSALVLVVVLGGLAACSSSRPSPADWASLASVLSAEEYAETFLDELADRLDAADLDLSPDQSELVYVALRDAAERQRMIASDADAGTPAAQIDAALADGQAQTDAAVEAVLTPEQVPVYQALQVEARAFLRRQISGG